MQKNINMWVKKILFALLILFVTSTYAQTRDIEKPFAINLGVNFIDTSGNQNPFFIFGSNNKTAFKNPFELGLSYELSNAIGIYANLSLNKLSDVIVDGNTDIEDLNYTAIDIGARYYFYYWDFSRESTLEFYFHGGMGLFNIDATSLSVNLGAGIRYWFDSSFGLYIEPTAKFALDNKTVQSNHFQYSVGLLYRFN